MTLTERIVLTFQQAEARIQAAKPQTVAPRLVAQDAAAPSTKVEDAAPAPTEKVDLRF